MIILKKKQSNYPITNKDGVYRERNEIVRVMLTGNAEIVIYRDKPGHLLFGLFNPLPKPPQN
jgi:hypothetical protein